MSVHTGGCRITALLAVGLVGAVLFASNIGVAQQAASAPGSPTSADSGAAIVTGRVLDVDGHGIAEATVEWYQEDRPFKSRKRVTTDNDGRYRLPAKAGQVHRVLAASKPGYRTSASTSQFSPGENVLDFVLSGIPANSHAIAGTVVDEQGEPIAGVRVEAFTPVVGFYSSFSTPTGRDYFPGPDRVTHTDEQGRFGLTDLPPDYALVHRMVAPEVRLNLTAKHRHVNEANYPPEQDLQITMRGSGKPGIVQGRIVDAQTGLPPTGVGDIRIVRRHSPTAYKCVGEGGYFQLPSERTLGNTYSVYVFAKSYAATSARLTAVPLGSSAFPQVELKKGPLLEGRLVDDDTGQPIVGGGLLYGVADKDRRHPYFEWSSFDRYADGYHSLEYVQRDTTGANGEFWFAEPAGNARGMVIVLLEGYQRHFLHPKARRPEEKTGEFVIRLKKESAFEGVVTKDGQPLPNVSVRISGNATYGIDNMYEWVSTDEQGRYKYGRLTPGTYLVRAGGYVRSAKVGNGETVTLNLGDDLGPLRIYGKARPRAWITITPTFTWDYVRFRVRADDEGQYEFTGLKPGQYRIKIDGASRRRSNSRNDVYIDIEHDQQIDLLPSSNSKTAD